MLFKSFVICVLLLGLCTNASPLPNAAFESYIKIKGSKQPQNTEREASSCQTTDCTGTDLPAPVSTPLALAQREAVGPGPDPVLPIKSSCGIPEGGKYAQCPGDGPAPNRPYPQERASDDWNAPGSVRREEGDGGVLVRSTA